MVNRSDKSNSFSATKSPSEGAFVLEILFQEKRLLNFVEDVLVNLRLRANHFLLSYIEFLSRQ